MDFRKLESFVSIVKHGSFTRAAEELYLTQPTITGHIQSLENRLGTVLLNRNGKTVSLTEAGQILYNHALNILSTREHALLSLAQYEGRLEGNLAIASSTVPQRSILPSLLAAFRQKYPQITFAIKQFDSRGVIDAIVSGAMDFGFVGRDPSMPDLEVNELCQARLMVIAPCRGNFQSTDGTTIAWNQVKNEPFILREEGSASRTLFLHSLEGKGIDPGELRVAATIENPDTIKQCVMAGLGVAVVSERSVEDEIRLGLLKGFYISGFDLVQSFYFINHRRRVLSPIAAAFKEFTAEYFQVP
ncbi:MAG: LysR family transcriptional regulator [Firmicutes bacterium]|nr:LysR family transcriptional regulator [Bacillota bacterium]